jgi:hypothetical protein
MAAVKQWYRALYRQFVSDIRAAIWRSWLGGIYQASVTR